MKKIGIFLLCLFSMFFIVGCGKEEEQKVEEKEEEKLVLSNDNIKIDGMYVDSSSENDKGLRKFVVFYTITATDENYRLSSTSLSLKINGKNSYSSSIDSSYSQNLTDYTYSEYIKDIYVGKNLKFASTFEVPRSDLEGSKSIELSVYSASNLFKGLKITTDAIKEVDSVKKMCEDVDKETYDKLVAQENNKMAKVSDATRNKVRKLINGYYYDFPTYLGQTYITYRLEFFSPNKFKVTSRISGSSISNTGTYEVRKEYIILKYSNSGQTLKMHYEIKNGDVYADCPFPSNGQDEIF